MGADWIRDSHRNSVGADAHWYREQRHQLCSTADMANCGLAMDGYYRYDHCDVDDFDRICLHLDRAIPFGGHYMETRALDSPSERLRLCCGCCVCRDNANCDLIFAKNCVNHAVHRSGGRSGLEMKPYLPPPGDGGR